MKGRRMKRSRSPLTTNTDEGPSHTTAGDARRIAELEAEVGELRSKMATLDTLLGADTLHDCDEVRALRAAQCRNSGGSGCGLLHIQQESARRVSEAMLTAVREETHRLESTAIERINPVAFAQWTLPHGIVPSLVANHVVVPFADLDWIVSGPGAPRTVLLGAQAVREATQNIRSLLEADVVLSPDIPLFDLCRKLPAFATSTTLRRFTEVLTPLAQQWSGFAFIRSWCACRARDFSAAGGVFATASRAADWRKIIACHELTGQRILARLAAAAVSPDQVVALCELIPCPHSAKVSEVRLSEYVWTKIFNSLVQRATTTDAIAALCNAVRKFSSVESYGCLDLRAVTQFFVTLVPAATADLTTLKHVVNALCHVVSLSTASKFRAGSDCPLCTADAENFVSASANFPYPSDFYRDFILPITQAAESPEAVYLACVAFSVTFGASWVFDDETSLLCTLTRFTTIISSATCASTCTSEAEREFLMAAVTSLATVIRRMAAEPSTLALVNGALDTVILPLVPASQGNEAACGELHKAVVSVAMFRSYNWGDSSQPFLERVMQQLKQK